MDKYLEFETRNQFRKWLEENVGSAHELWIIFRKNHGLKASEALEEALCFGWIDGLIKNIDDDSYMKKFTERLPKSNWSEKNKKLIEELETRGLMTDYGRRKITEAVVNGTWYLSPGEDISEEDVERFIEMVRDDISAYENLIKMSPSVKRTYAKHYYSAKTDATKEKRFKEIIARLQENKKPM